MVPGLEVEEPEFGTTEWHAKYDVTCEGGVFFMPGVTFNKIEGDND